MLHADKIFYNARFITMEREGDEVEALAVYDGKIVATGSRASVLELKGAETEMVDCGGGVVFPGFSDTHTLTFSAPH